jgi:hypothetical protein
MSAIKQKREPGADTLVSCFDCEEMNMSLINATAPLLADPHSCDTEHSDTAPATEGVLPYDPNRLLDTVAQRLGINGDRMLSRMLQLSLQIIRGMRAGRLPVRASILLSIAESVGTSIDELRQILGDRRSKARMSFTLLAT